MPLPSECGTDLWNNPSLHGCTCHVTLRLYQVLALWLHLLLIRGGSPNYLILTWLYCSLGYCLKGVTSLKAKDSIGQMCISADRNLHSASWSFRLGVWASTLTHKIIWFKDPIALLWIIFKAQGCIMVWKRKLVVSHVGQSIRILSLVKWWAARASTLEHWYSNLRHSRVHHKHKEEQAYTGAVGNIENNKCHKHCCHILSAHRDTGIIQQLNALLSMVSMVTVIVTGWCCRCTVVWCAYCSSPRVLESSASPSLPAQTTTVDSSQFPLSKSLFPLESTSMK